jgi:hypothetical protein
MFRLNEKTDIVKIREEVIEIENLVNRIMYFAIKSNDPRYIKVIVTNLAKRLLTFLKIEHRDIEHLFEHELPQHNYVSHTVKAESEHLHVVLKKEEKRIKKAVSRIPHVCDRLVDGKISREDFMKEIEAACKEILMLCGSEKHNLEFIRGFMQ